MPTENSATEDYPARQRSERSSGRLRTHGVCLPLFSSNVFTTDPYKWPLGISIQAASWNIVNHVSITRNRLMPLSSKLVREVIRADLDAAQQGDTPNWQPFGN